MIPTNRRTAIHKLYLLRLLTTIVDHPTLALELYFKGGTAAAMQGFLDRFSVDLDFDLAPGGNASDTRQHLVEIFDQLSLPVDRASTTSLFFSVKYPAPTNARNTIHISVFESVVKANIYQPQYLPEINRMVTCQTLETMVANKLVTPLDRWQKHEAIAGRDFYDIHHFLSLGYGYEAGVITERSSLTVKEFFGQLAKFVDKNVTQDIINQDLNTLLPFDKFSILRTRLKDELLTLLIDEYARL